MNDLKVNARTKILEFKKKHNLLVDAVDEIPNTITTTNITNLTTEQINSLKSGDIVLKQDETGNHAYIVSYNKDKTGICLTYTDASRVETVSYDFTNNAWVYNSTDVTEFENFTNEQAVKNLIQADKDILSQITREGHGPYTIVFPKNVLPLKLTINSSGSIYKNVYFDYQNLIVLKENGTQDSSGEITVENNQIKITGTSFSTLSTIKNIDYILFDGDHLDKLNSYYLYNPVISTGTKLYKHRIDLKLHSDNSKFLTLTIVSSNPNKLTYTEVMNAFNSHVCYAYVINDTYIYIGPEALALYDFGVYSSYYTKSLMFKGKSICEFAYNNQLLELNYGQLEIDTTNNTFNLNITGTLVFDYLQEYDTVTPL